MPQGAEGSASSPEYTPHSGNALLIITVYDRAIAHPYYVHRSSTYALLSSQTLGDLYDAIPCPSKEYPGEMRNEDGQLTGYDLKKRDLSGCVMCVSGTAYGDGLEVEDYAECDLCFLRFYENRVDQHHSKLCQYLDYSAKQSSASSRPAISLRRGSNIHDVQFRSLKLSLHFPNWILHHGNCEHYFVVDQIR